MTAPPHSSGQAAAGKSRLRFWKTLLALLGAGLVLLGAGRVLLVQGWLQAVRIEGASMVPALLGEHRRETCTACGFGFPCEPQQDGAEISCPNCGQEGFAAGPTVPGERVLVDRLPAIAGTWQRWDVAALQLASGEKAVKRIVGLPGERLAIAHGELLVDGELVRKSLREFREMAVLVHDDRFRPRQNPRWVPEHENESPREAFESGYRLNTTAGSEGANWLVFRNIRCFVSPLPPGEEIPVQNDLPFNQSHRQELHEVADLLLELRLTLSPGATAAVRLSGQPSTWQVELSAAEQSARLLCDGSPVARVAASLPAGKPVRVEAGRWDEQVVLGIAGRELLRFPASDEEPGTVNGISSRPLAIGGWGGAIVFEQLQVYRDVYYLGPHGSTARWEAGRLGDGEYLLLGDNVAISADSRVWEPPGVAGGALWGRVLRWERGK